MVGWCRRAGAAGGMCQHQHPLRNAPRSAGQVILRSRQGAAGGPTHRGVGEGGQGEGRTGGDVHRLQAAERATSQPLGKTQLGQASG